VTAGVPVPVTVGLSIHLNVMDFSVEGALDLQSGSTEVDRHAVFGDFGDGEAVRLEPGGDSGDVGGGGAEF
jgi:hypothetical protein